MACRMAEDARAMGDRAAFRIGCPIPEARYPGERDGARAHGTGFERHRQPAPRQPFRAKRQSRGADHQKLGMCGRVGKFAHLVAGAGQHVSIRRREHGADRGLASCGGTARLFQRKLHMAGEHGFRPIADDAGRPALLPI